MKKLTYRDFVVLCLSDKEAYFLSHALESLLEIAKVYNKNYAKDDYIYEFKIYFEEAIELLSLLKESKVSK